MKSYIRPTLTHRERQIAAAEMDKITRKGICRAQWLMLIAFNEALGIGAQRIQRVMTSYAGLLTEFEAYARDGIEDEMLTRRLKQIGLDVKKLWEG